MEVEKVKKKRGRPKKRKVSEEVKKKHSERMLARWRQAREAKALECPEGCVFRIVVYQFANASSKVEFKWWDDKYMPSMRRFHDMWRDVLREFSAWKYRELRKGIKLEKISVPEAVKPVTEVPETAEVIENG